MKDLFSEFRPTLAFLGKFLTIYLIGNILYGVFIASCGNTPDPVTTATTMQTSWLLNLLGQNTDTAVSSPTPRVSLRNDKDVIINVYEGCNGINVMIIFVAFLFAFGGSWRRLLWFLPVGIAIIHLVNLARITLLYFTALNRPAEFYYFHKYFFTGILYVVVFALWGVWVSRVEEKAAGSHVA